MQLLTVEVFKSGREIKDAATARLNAAEINPIDPQLRAQLDVLTRNPKDDDRIKLTVDQLILLGL